MCFWELKAVFKCVQLMQEWVHIYAMCNLSLRKTIESHFNFKIMPNSKQLSFPRLNCCITFTIFMTVTAEALTWGLQCFIAMNIHTFPSCQLFQWSGSVASSGQRLHLAAAGCECVELCEKQLKTERTCLCSSLSLIQSNISFSCTGMLLWPPLLIHGTWSCMTACMLLFK